MAKVEHITREVMKPLLEPYVGAIPPGVMTRFGHALREPCGRVHWAGAETADEWPGYIEGARRGRCR